MKLICCKTIVGLILLLFALQAYAAMVIEAKVELDNNGKTGSHANIITVDDEKVRVDYLGAEGVKTETTPYLLTLDAGNTWVIGNREADKFYCADVNIEEYFRDIGDILARIDSLANAEFSNDKVELILEEPGPDMLGYATTYARIKTTASVKAYFLWFKYRYSLEKIDDVWFIKNRKLHPAKERWVHALTNSGYGNLDKLTGAFREKITGTILKHESVVRLTNEKKKEVETYIRKIEFVSVQELNSSEVPRDTFAKPECIELDKDKFKAVTDSMLKEGKWTL